MRGVRTRRLCFEVVVLYSNWAMDLESVLWISIPVKQGEQVHVSDKMEYVISS